jgi:Polyketide cyclase / dehydrase and lipid transport
MTEVWERCELGSPAREVWGLLTDFGGFVEMLVAQREGTVQTHGTGVGMTRTVTVGEDQMLERLEEVDEANWRTRYSMLVTGPLPIADYQATISLTELGPTRCAVDWVGSFVPSGANAEDAVATVRAVYADGIALMRKRFGE